jgi:hypothetical protein
MHAVRSQRAARADGSDSGQRGVVGQHAGAAERCRIQVVSAGGRLSRRRRNRGHRDGGQSNRQPGIQAGPALHMLDVHVSALGHATTLTLAHTSASWTRARGLKPTLCICRRLPAKSPALRILRRV